MAPPQKPKFEGGCDAPEDAFMVPLRWVSTTSKKDDANMEMYNMSAISDAPPPWRSLKIPTLRNNQALKPFTRLFRFQEAPAPKSSSLQIAQADTDKAAKKSRKS